MSITETAAIALPPVAPPSAPPVAARTRMLLEAPIAATLLRLAVPNLVVMLVQSALGLVETYFVSWLGTAAVAGVSLVFPVLMLMQMMSAGAIGGGISAAVARALGAGRRKDADALAMQAVWLALGLGAIFTVAVVGFGRLLYVALGGDGATLAAALTYSDIVFAAALLVWLLNALSSVIRGTGNMTVPAAVICGGAVIMTPLSAALILGLGPFSRLGVAGGGAAIALYYAGGVAFLFWYIASGRSLVRFRRGLLRPRAALLWDILRVGGVAALNTVQTNLTVAIVTGLMGTLGAAAIAGYGIGSRLEYLLVPLVFGLGAPLTAMVGTNVGAGRVDRAQRVAWIGAGVAFVMTETIGLLAAAFPTAWIGLFTDDPAALAMGSLYLRLVGPFFGTFGAGMALYFAAQGAGRMLWPFTGGLLRLFVAAGGGWLAFDRLGFGAAGVFAMVAVGLVVFGGVNAAAVAAGAWRRR